MSVRPVDRDPNRGRRAVPLVTFTAADLLGLNDDEYDEDPCGGTGVVECWNPGGPCPVPNDPDCETCGRCISCAIDRDPT